MLLGILNSLRIRNQAQCAGKPSPTIHVLLAISQSYVIFVIRSKLSVAFPESFTMAWSHSPRNIRNLVISSTSFVRGESFRRLGQYWRRTRSLVAEGMRDGTHDWHVLLLLPCYSSQSNFKSAWSNVVACIDSQSWPSTTEESEFPGKTRTMISRYWWLRGGYDNSFSWSPRGGRNLAPPPIPRQNWPEGPSALNLCSKIHQGWHSHGPANPDAKWVLKIFRENPIGREPHHGTARNGTKITEAANFLYVLMLNLHGRCEFALE